MKKKIYLVEVGGVFDISASNKQEAIEYVVQRVRDNPNLLIREVSHLYTDRGNFDVKKVDLLS